MPQKFVTATISEKASEASLPIVEGTMGPAAVDIQSLYGRHNLLAYDPGYRSTASCKSAITFVDGDAGVLLYRGYPIAELAEKSSFAEVAFLLLFGELPTKGQFESFEEQIHQHNLLHEQVISFYRGFRRDAHPMAIMVGVVGALSAFYHEHLDIHDEQQRLNAAVRLVAKMPTIAAASYTYSIGRPLRYPWNNLNYASNFMQMLFGMPNQEFQVDPVQARAMDAIMILHADH